MSKLTESRLACRLKECNRAGIITGLVIAVVVITLVVIAVMKMQWIKKQLGRVDCDDDMFDEDFDFEDDCTCESDFV